MDNTNMQAKKMTVDEAKETLEHLENCSAEQKCFIKGVIEGMRFQNTNQTAKTTTPA